MIDLLLSRYGSVDLVFKMPFSQAAKLIKKAYEQRTEDKAWDMWLQIYPDMVVPRKVVQKNNQSYREPIIKFVKFSEFLRKIKNPEISQRPAEDIMREVTDIRERIKARKEAAQQ